MNPAMTGVETFSILAMVGLDPTNQRKGWVIGSGPMMERTGGNYVEKI
jgi:hypothetical protein